MAINVPPPPPPCRRVAYEEAPWKSQLRLRKQVIWREPEVFPSKFKKRSGCNIEALPERSSVVKKSSLFQKRSWSQSHKDLRVRANLIEDQNLDEVPATFTVHGSKANVEALAKDVISYVRPFNPRLAKARHDPRNVHSHSFANEDTFLQKQRTARSHALAHLQVPASSSGFPEDVHMEAFHHQDEKWEAGRHEDAEWDQCQEEANDEGNSH